MRKEEFKTYCLEKLQSIESLLDTVTSFTPITRLRLNTKQHILRHLIDYETCFNFYSIEDMERYIEDRTNVICGFYDEDEIEH